MIIWLASYPRSGNTLLRVMLNHIFGLKTWSLYNDTLDLGADPATAAAVGHQFLEPGFQPASAAADGQRWLIKTHDYPDDDERAIYVVRDGRETLTSYLFYFQRILGQQPALRDLIAGATPFGSWSDHLAAWRPLTRPGTLLLRFEDVLADPQATVAALAGFLEVEPVAQRMPSFDELRELNPAFFRSGRNDTWPALFSPEDEALFWELHGPAMVEYGYAAPPAEWDAARRARPAALVATPGELRGQRPSGLPADPAQADPAQLAGMLGERNAEIVRLRGALALGRREIQRSEADRLARLELIERQGAELGRIAGLEQQVADLTARLEASEADRLARLELIERQGVELGRLAPFEPYAADLAERLHISEADRAARLAVIERQGADIDELRRRLLAMQELLGMLRRPQRLARPRNWRRARALVAELRRYRPPAQDGAPPLPLADYIATVDAFTAGAQHADLMRRIRAYNHTIIDDFNKSRRLAGKRLLDIGASPHGYALERALKHAVAEYVGIGLDVDEPVVVQGPAGCGRLLNMNAERLEFPDASFDLVVSLSTFEHITSVPSALAEIARVLRPGGSALITFEPLWTCSYGHHLHHFGPVSELVPPWAHLRWTKQAMLDALAPVWPADAPLTLQQAAEWTYDSDAINRVGIVEMRGHFAASSLATEWLVPLSDEPRDPARLSEAAAATGLTPDDLMTKGFAVLLNKPAAPQPHDEQTHAPDGAERPAQHGRGPVVADYMEQIRMTVRLLRSRRAQAAQPAVAVAQPAAQPALAAVAAAPVAAAPAGDGAYVLSPTEAALAAAEVVPGAADEPTEQEYYAQIREPKAQSVVHYDEQNLAQITAELRALGFTVKELTVDVQAYREYFAAAQYPPSYYAFNLPEKSLEHYIAAQLLELGPDDLYIDIASEHSPVPEIYSRLYGCTSYRQDLAYPAGLNGDRIGGDAAAMPVPDGFASKMALHCSFEHFEGDADSRFMRECGRVLRSGGRVCFAPIYLFTELVNQAGAAAAVKGKVEFDEGATVYAKPGWRHRFARYYGPAALASRVRAHAGDLELTIYQVLNAREVDQSCYIRYVLLAHKP